MFIIASSPDSAVMGWWHIWLKSYPGKLARSESDTICRKGNQPISWRRTVTLLADMTSKYWPPELSSSNLPIFTVTMSQNRISLTHWMPFIDLHITDFYPIFYIYASTKYQEYLVLPQCEVFSQIITAIWSKFTWISTIIKILQIVHKKIQNMFPNCLFHSQLT